MVGVIREAAKAAGKLVRAFLILDGTRGDVRVFREKVGSKYLDFELVENLVRVLEIERAQRVSRVEFAKGDKILLESDGNWKILKVSRLKEFVGMIDEAVQNFPTGIKR